MNPDHIDYHYSQQESERIFSGWVLVMQQNHFQSYEEHDVCVQKMVQPWGKEDLKLLLWRNYRKIVKTILHTVTPLGSTNLRSIAYKSQNIRPTLWKKERREVKWHDMLSRNLLEGDWKSKRAEELNSENLINDSFYQPILITYKITNFSDQRSIAICRLVGSYKVIHERNCEVEGQKNLKIIIGIWTPYKQMQTIRTKFKIVM